MKKLIFCFISALLMGQVSLAGESDTVFVNSETVNSFIKNGFFCIDSSAVYIFQVKLIRMTVNVRGDKNKVIIYDLDSEGKKEDWNEGLNMDGCVDVELHDSKLKDYYIGAYAISTKSSVVRNCDFIDCCFGTILFDISNYNEVSQNRFIDNEIGIEITKSHWNLIQDNEGSCKRFGIWVNERSWNNEGINYIVGDSLNIFYTDSSLIERNNLICITDVNSKMLFPQRMGLSQNYPNPFNPITTINFTIPKNGNVKLTVINMAGQVVDVLLDEYCQSGKHSVIWNAQGLATGIYFYRLEAGDFNAVKKLTLVR